MCYAPLGGAAGVTRETLYNLLQQCRSPTSGRQVQKLIHQNGFANDPFLAAHLIRMFTFFKSLPEAQQVFQNLSNPNAFVWSAIISAHAHLGRSYQAFDLYIHMQQQSDALPNQYVFVSILKACANTADLLFCRLIHSHVIECGFEGKIIVINTLLDVYGKCGDLEDGSNIFSYTCGRDVITWNAMIAAYCHNHYVEQAVLLFNQMQEEGFEPDCATWNSLISAYALLGQHETSFVLFKMMLMEGLCPNQASFVSIMHAMPSLEQGRTVHVQILATDFRFNHVVGSSLIDMYARFGSLEGAHRVFDGLKQRDLVTWNAMIGAYAQHGYGHLAFQLFVQMQELGLKHDNYTFVSIIKACTSIGAVDKGKQVHCFVLERGYESDVYVGSALIDMYCKWHRLRDGLVVFETVPRPNIAIWNAMVSGYAQHRDFKEAWSLVESMKIKGAMPDAVTFLCLLSACGQEALVEQAIGHLASMHTAHGIKPSLNHFTCILDILGRAGCLDEALQIQQMIPSLLSEIVWRSLLSHCKTHGSFELGKQCFDKITTLEERDSASFVLMSQLCTNVGEWGEAIKLEERRKFVGAQKKPGMAFIEVSNEVHHFLVGNLSYPTEEKPSCKMRRLKVLMFEGGYMPSLDLLFTRSTC
ncbi:hypothetical protein L7F22_052151 [Adiantum nelumboides]|nr:hypothetical protein [Adiantum nelumboides]